MELNRTRTKDTTPAAWMTYKGGASYSGLSTRLLEDAVKDNLIVSSLVTKPGATRGRRLINRASLDAWIEAGIGSAAELPQFNAGKEKV